MSHSERSDGSDSSEGSEGDDNRSAGRRDFAARGISTSTAGLLARDAEAFLRQSLSTPCLTAVQRAEGAYLEDTDGHRYLDFHGNNVHHIGYGHPRLKRAIAEQMDALPFAPRRFTCEPAVLLAEKLRALAPPPLSKILFTTGGSDAIDVAIKLARLRTGRFKTVSFWDSFHGAGFGGSSVGGESLFRGAGIGPLLPGTEHVAPFHCYRCPYGHRDVVGEDGRPDVERCGLTCAAYLRYVLEKEGDVAAVIAEPVRAVPYVPPPGYWQSVRQACDDHGALLIFDEIPTGLGKTGAMFACEHTGVVPDIVVLGKALGGGILPIAAVLARPELDVASHLALGHYTHEKNPVTCRAALTTLEIIEDEGLVENARRMGAYALTRLQALRERHACIGDVRGVGLLLGVELVTDRALRTPDARGADQVLYSALRRGLSFKTTMGNILTLTPPLTVKHEQIDFAVAVLDACLGELRS